MPRKITERIPLDEIEEEVLFTQAVLAADPDSKDLSIDAEDWLDAVDEMREKERQLRREVAHVEAARMIADNRLNEACNRFGAELTFDTRNDRESPRFRQFFSIPASRLAKMSLSKRVVTVRAWLGSEDVVLSKHREALETWVNQADQAVVETQRQSLKRKEMQIAREKLAMDLTRKRDSLAESLAERAREKDLDREWSKAFFRTGRSSSNGEQEVEEPETEETS